MSAYRRIGVSAYRRIGVIGVSAWSAFGVAARVAGRDALLRVRRGTSINRKHPSSRATLRCCGPFLLASAIFTFARSVDVPRRTRRSASTVRGAAPDVNIGRAAADRAGARPYQGRRLLFDTPMITRRSSTKLMTLLKTR